MDGIKEVINSKYISYPRQGYIYSAEEGNLNRYLYMTDNTDMNKITALHKTEIKGLSFEQRMLTNPLPVKVFLSEKLFKIREKMIQENLLINV